MWNVEPIWFTVKELDWAPNNCDIYCKVEDRWRNDYGNYMFHLLLTL